MTSLNDARLLMRKTLHCHLTSNGRHSIDIMTSNAYMPHALTSYKNYPLTSYISYLDTQLRPYLTWEWSQLVFEAIVIIYQMRRSDVYQKKRTDVILLIISWRICFQLTRGFFAFTRQKYSVHVYISRIFLRFITSKEIKKGKDE